MPAKPSIRKARKAKNTSAWERRGFLRNTTVKRIKRSKKR